MAKHELPKLRSWVRFPSFAPYKVNKKFFVMKFMVIAISGHSGSGKSTFASLLSKKINAVVCEVDIFFREAFLENKDIMKAFCGNGCINSDGTINFGILSKIPTEKDLAVRQILRASMDEKMREFIEVANQKGQSVVFDYLFLTDCKTLMNADIKILVDAPLETRYKRMLTRNNGRFKFSLEEFEAMSKLVDGTISGFKPDIVIDNTQDNGLENQVNKVLKYLENVNSTK